MVIIVSENHQYTLETFEGWIIKPAIIDDNVWTGYKVRVFMSGGMPLSVPCGRVIGGVPAKVIKIHK